MVTRLANTGTRGPMSPGAGELRKLERERRRTLKQEHDFELQKMLVERLLNPNLIRLAMGAGIIAYATHCARSQENVGAVQSALAFAGTGIGIPMLAADAGIKDKWALAAISAAGTAYTTGQMMQGWKDAGVIPNLSLSDIWHELTPWED